MNLTVSEVILNLLYSRRAANRMPHVLQACRIILNLLYSRRAAKRMPRVLQYAISIGNKNALQSNK